MISQFRSIATCAKPQLQRAPLNFSALSTPFKDLFEKKLFAPSTKKDDCSKKGRSISFCLLFPTPKKQSQTTGAKALYMLNCGEVGVPSTAIRKLQLFSKIL